MKPKAGFWNQKIPIFFLFWVAGVIAPLWSWGSDWRAQQQYLSPSRIFGIEWPPDGFELEVEADPDNDKKFKVYAVIEGQYPRKNWSLLVRAKRIPRNAKNQFRFRVRLAGKETPIRILAVSESGETENETFSIVVSNWESLLQEAAEAKDQRLRYSVGLGYTFMTYSETGAVSKLSVQALTPKFRIGYQIAPPDWDIEFNIYYNAWPISQEGSEEKVRFLGANLRAGSALGWFDHPWRFSLMAGVSYNHTIVTNNAFGFEHLVYAQLYPILRRELKNLSSIYMYLKYVPFSLNFSEREVAVGGGYAIPTGKLSRFTIGIDFSDLRIVLAREHVLQSVTLNLGMGI